MTDENGVNPDAETVTVTDIFFAGGLRVQAKGDVVSQVKSAASKENWSKLEDLNGNECQVRAADALAMVVSHPQLVRQQMPAKPAGTPGGPEFKPVVME